MVEALASLVRQMFARLDLEPRRNALGSGPTLREIELGSGAPSSETVAEYLAGSGQATAKGATRAAKWYDEVRAGKRHLDYARRLI